IKKETMEKIATSIQEKLALIKAKKRELNDEEKGAIKVNEYLTHFFGHKFLSLEAKENEEDEFGNKNIRFEVIRDERKAYHLSEGECSLLAFCYFLAKLDDTETNGQKPIIWIDDPISSLDANHIFFVFSLLFEEIVLKGRFQQLFISTHNLDFLKYLKRLRGKFKNENGKMQDYNQRFFVVERVWKESNIKLMPDYLKEYVTEFNYLFHQIYKCSKIESVTDDNYQTFYNFPNNARKFLEIFLYYKFPHGMKDHNGTIHTKNLTKFFGGKLIPTVLTTRINNEYSHLAGGFERGANPVDVPEMKQVAKFIVDRLREDTDQFAAFLSSIGETEIETLAEDAMV
ncbi:MAG: AAA family ATPase, partial [Spirochaetaceae bacterium]|nr:AAA family ATPase [Spirochaetaceae bacterium]